MPSSSSHLYNLMEASEVMGRERSQVSPFTPIDNTSCASRELMLSAICSPVVPSAKGRTEPSGNVMLIILFLNLTNGFLMVFNQNCKDRKIC